jgi:hypothetical protein
MRNAFGLPGLLAAASSASSTLCLFRYVRIPSSSPANVAADRFRSDSRFTRSPKNIPTADPRSEKTPVIPIPMYWDHQGEGLAKFEAVAMSKFTLELLSKIEHPGEGDLPKTCYDLLSRLRDTFSSKRGKVSLRKRLNLGRA